MNDFFTHVCRMYISPAATEGEALCKMMAHWRRRGWGGGGGEALTLLYHTV